MAGPQLDLEDPTPPHPTPVWEGAGSRAWTSAWSSGISSWGRSASPPLALARGGQGWPCLEAGRLLLLGFLLAGVPGQGILSASQMQGDSRTRHHVPCAFRQVITLPSAP